jgi:hypothetical protein
MAAVRLVVRSLTGVAAGVAAGPAPVRVALVVERAPVVVPPPTPLEAAYDTYRGRLAEERSKPFVPDFFTKKTDAKADAGGADGASADGAEGGEDKVVYAPMTTAADAAGQTATQDRCALRARACAVVGSDRG